MSENFAGRDVRRRLPIGAEVQPKGVHFRVWAPLSRSVAVILGDEEALTHSVETAMKPEAAGYWSVLVPEAHAGMHYRYRIESGAYPDPASRFQPAGPHGASQIVDSSDFKWTDS